MFRAYFQQAVLANDDNAPICHSHNEGEARTILASKATSAAVARSKAASASTRLSTARRPLIYDAVTRQWVRAPAEHLNRAAGSSYGQGLGGLQAKTERLLLQQQDQAIGSGSSSSSKETLDALKKNNNSIAGGDKATLHAAPIQEAEEATARPEALIGGLTIPSKPDAPGDEDCCQSGCVAAA